TRTQRALYGRDFGIRYGNGYRDSYGYRYTPSAGRPVQAHPGPGGRAARQKGRWHAHQGPDDRVRAAQGHGASVPGGGVRGVASPETRSVSVTSTDTATVIQLPRAAR